MQLFSQKDPTRYVLEVTDVGDLSIRVVRSASGTVRIPELGIDLAQVTEELERDGIAKFADSYDALLTLLDRKRFDVSREYASG